MIIIKQKTAGVRRTLLSSNFFVCLGITCIVIQSEDG